MKYRYKIVIEYDGTNYAGWQKQKNQNTIQGTIEHAFAQFIHYPIEIVGSGRTDAGVHAQAQHAHFDMDNKISEIKLKNSLNHFLKQENVVITQCEIVKPEFHARFDAKLRKYRYLIVNRKEPLAILKHKAWLVKTKLNVQHMNQAVQCLVGTHNLTSFRATGCQAKSPIKTIHSIKIYSSSCDKQIICMDIIAKSFLYKQVRNIIGTVKQVGEQKLSVNDFYHILKAQARSQAGITAPPHGLYFLDTIY